MQAGHVQAATPRDPDIAWLTAQHAHDVQALERAADRIAHLEREKQILIHQAKGMVRLA